MNDEGADLRALIETLDPKARDDLRRVLIRRPGRPRRDLLTFDALPRQERQDWAEIIDFLTMYPDARRQVARVIGEIDATSR